MVVATSKHNEIFDKLVTLAGGDIDLVRQAIRATAKADGSSSLVDVVKEIQNRRSTDRRSAARNESRMERATA